MTPPTAATLPLQWPDRPLVEPSLEDYDLILANTSAGKDSQVAMDVVVDRARAAGVLDRVVAVHCDLGRVEWPGTGELAETQARHYGLRFEVVRNTNHVDLLARVEHRRARLDADGRYDTPPWPSATSRWCTSELKTAAVKKLATRLVAELDPSHSRQVRILNCLGLRAEESPARAKKRPFRHHPPGAGWSNSRRAVDEWLPIHHWTVDEVWARIHATGVPYHPAYDLGMPRLSCCFCVLASKSALVLAARHNRALADAYVRTEVRVRSKFRADLSMADVVAEADAAGEPPAVEDWAA